MQITTKNSNFSIFSPSFFFSNISGNLNTLNKTCNTSIIFQLKDWITQQAELGSLPFKIFSTSNISQIGNAAFYLCTALTSINCPNVTSIGGYAFASCTSLTSINCSNVTSIGGYAFASCTSLTSINYPNVSIIENGTFASCTSLTSVNLPNVTAIGSNAFASCSALTSIYFSKVKSINTRAFYGCTSLVSINFPAVTTISSMAFYNCPQLSAIYLLGSSIPVLQNSNAFFSYNLSSATIAVNPKIYVLSSLYASFKTATNWSYFSACFVSVSNAE